MSDGAEESGSLSRSERWCDEFAAAFLMPAGEVSRLALRSLGEDTVLPVAKRFRVSALALLNRLRDLKLISFEQWSVAYPEFEARALEVLRQKTEKGSSGGEFYKSHPFVVGPRFARAVYREARSGRMSYLDAQRLLGVRQTKTFERIEPGEKGGSDYGPGDLGQKHFLKSGLSPFTQINTHTKS